MKFPWTGQNARATDPRTVELTLNSQNCQDVEFANITYTTQNKEKKIILKKVSGQFNAGELTAIMGPSGAGKSSLLHILTGFIKNGVEGNIRCNGKVMKSTGGGFRKEACYIMQENYLQQQFTVRELMMISANLKLGHSLSVKAKQLLVDDTLDLMGLSLCDNTRCDKLSGGQAKRLSIALELVDNPTTMFLDEPTTGLDSVSSLQCAKVLKAIACGGRTVVCTIHQPCASILEMFDQVYVLDRGECVYQGAYYNILPFLSQLGLECPQYHNPADFMLEVVTGEHGNYTEELIEASKKDIWKKPKAIVETETQAQNFKEKDTSRTLVFIQPPKEIERFWILFKCFYIQLNRDWTISHLKVAIHLICGVMFGVVFAESGIDATKVVSNLSLLYVLIIYLTYTAMMPAIMRFPLVRDILVKESFNNWYKLETYFAALTIASLPIQLVFTVVPVAVGYYLSSQPTDLYRFGMVMLVLYMSSLVAESFGLFFGTLCRPVMGTFFGALYSSYLIVFGGFLILFNHIPVYLYWLTYLDYTSYCFDALVTAIYGFDRGELTCPENIIYCHLSDSKLVLKEVSISGELYWFDAGMLFLFVTGVRVMCYCAFWYKV